MYSMQQGLEFAKVCTHQSSSHDEARVAILVEFPVCRLMNSLRRLLSKIICTHELKNDYYFVLGDIFGKPNPQQVGKNVCMDK